MFESKAVMWIYAVSPVHMGAGTAIGAIDNPIQRERHTEHPILAGSGLKGAMRDLWPPQDAKGIFGPEPSEKGSGSEHAGALAVGDGQIVLFPVRSLRQSYVYATCPTALARCRRLLELAGCKGEDVPRDVPDDKALLREERKAALCGKGGANAAPPRLVLETFAFEPQGEKAVAAWGEALASMLPNAVGNYFKEKVKNDLVVLSDTRFAYFVRNATVVEPHVRIDDETGTADDGGLFYTENVPPETLFISLLMASRVRGHDANRTAKDVLAEVKAKFKQQPLVQIGGDATSGRGQVVVGLTGGGV